MNYQKKGVRIEESMCHTLPTANEALIARIIG